MFKSVQKCSKVFNDHSPQIHRANVISAGEPESAKFVVKTNSKITNSTTWANWRRGSQDHPGRVCMSANFEEKLSTKNQVHTSDGNVMMQNKF